MIARAENELADDLETVLAGHHERGLIAAKFVFSQNKLAGVETGFVFD